MHGDGGGWLLQFAPLVEQTFHVFAERRYAETTRPRAKVSTPCLRASRTVRSPSKDATSIAATASSCHKQSPVAAVQAHGADDGKHGVLIFKHGQAGVVVVRSCFVAGPQRVVKGTSRRQGAVLGDGFKGAAQVTVDVLRETLGRQRQRRNACFGYRVPQGGHAPPDGFERFFIG